MIARVALSPDRRLAKRLHAAQEGNWASSRPSSASHQVPSDDSGQEPLLHAAHANTTRLLLAGLYDQTSSANLRSPPCDPTTARTRWFDSYPICFQRASSVVGALLLLHSHSLRRHRPRHTGLTRVPCNQVRKLVTVLSPGPEQATSQAVPPLECRPHLLARTGGSLFENGSEQQARVCEPSNVSLSLRLILGNSD